MDKPNHRVYVVTQARSGSSMLTGIVDRLGVDMKYTTESDEIIEGRAKREAKRHGEGGYQMNPHFYEITFNAFENWHNIYMTPFSGCKVIMPVQGLCWSAVTSRPAKVLLLWRDSAEIRQSQVASMTQALVSSTGPDDNEPWENTEANIRSIHARTEIQLQRRVEASNNARFNDANDTQPFTFMVVKYRDVLANPKKEITKIARWIGADPELIDYAVASVDPSKIRFKKEELSEGI